MIEKMKKNFEIPMLQVVSISKNNIIVTSTFTVTNDLYQGVVKAPDRFDIWYEGE